MAITRETYEQQLREHLRHCRQARPIPALEMLSPLEEAQYRILGGHLIQWLQSWGPGLLSERATLEQIFGREATQPLICFQTSIPGLVAAQQILGEEHPRVVYGLCEEFRAFPIRDELFQYHVELISLFEPGNAAKFGGELVSRYPLREGEQYWFHYDETVLGNLFARGCRHLWKWDGKQLTLLEEAFERWLS